MKRTRRFSQENSGSFKNHQNVFLSDLIRFRPLSRDWSRGASWYCRFWLYFDLWNALYKHLRSFETQKFSWGAYSAPQTPSCLVTSLWIINELNGRKLRAHWAKRWDGSQMPCKTTKKSPEGRLFCGLTRHLINNSWKRCKNFHFFSLFLTFGGWDWNHFVQNFMENKKKWIF